MSATVDRPEKADRAVSSPEMLSQRLRAVSEAWRERDEDAIRTELRALSDEASLLSRTEPLLPRPVRTRQRVAAEAAAARNERGPGGQLSATRTANAPTARVLMKWAP